MNTENNPKQKGRKMTNRLSLEKQFILNDVMISLTDQERSRPYEETARLVNKQLKDFKVTPLNIRGYYLAKGWPAPENKRKSKIKELEERINQLEQKLNELIAREIRKKPYSGSSCSVGDDGIPRYQEKIHWAKLGSVFCIRAETIKRWKYNNRMPVDSMASIIKWAEEHGKIPAGKFTPEDFK